MVLNRLNVLLILPVFLVCFVQGCDSTKLSSEDPQFKVTPQERAPRVSELILGPGDRLEISVYRHDDLNREVWIDPSGKIMYPLAGDIHVTGLSTFSLRDKIREGLARYIVDPQVTVKILSIESQKIIVLGEVRSPGFFPSETSMNVIEAIARAGGASGDANQKTVMLIRGGMENPDLRLLNIDKAFREGNLSDNIMLQGGDIVYMPRTKIADVSKFFGYLYTIIQPIVVGERGYLLGDEILSGSTNSSVRSR